MPNHQGSLARRPRRWGAVLLIAVAGFGAAALIGTAVAKTFTLHVDQNANVFDTTGMSKHESILVTSRGFVLYTLSGETTRHALCTKAKGCFPFWPPLTVSSAKKLSKAPGVKGRLGVWHRDGFVQVTLNGHPVYRFAPDTHRGVATGEGIQSFGGTWHVVKQPGMTASTSTPMPTTTTTTTMSTTSSSATTTMSSTTSTTTTYPYTYAPKS